jgi:hypothetical protein
MLSDGCSLEGFYSFRTLWRKEFKLLKGKSSTEKKDFLILFHPGFKIDVVEF